MRARALIALLAASLLLNVWVVLSSGSDPDDRARAARHPARAEVAPSPLSSDGATDAAPPASVAVTAAPAERDQDRPAPPPGPTPELIERLSRLQGWDERERLIPDAARDLLLRAASDPDLALERLLAIAAASDRPESQRLTALQAIQVFVDQFSSETRGRLQSRAFEACLALAGRERDDDLLAAFLARMHHNAPFTDDGAEGRQEPVLVAALRDSSLRRARLVAVQALGNSSRPTARRELLRVARGDPDRPLRREATCLLDPTTGPDELEAILELSRDAEAGVRQAAFYSFVKLPEERAVPRLVQALASEPDPNVTDTAIDQLLQIGSDEALRALRAYAADPGRPERLRELARSADPKPR